MSKKLTGWYPPEIKPVHIGVYERLYGEQDSRFNKWNGRKWCFYADTPQEASREVTHSFSQMLKWRGLAEPPK